MIQRPLWADLHNQNAVGCGSGSLDRTYAIARGGLLDVLCFTPHGYWPDVPKNDPKTVEHHRAGFQRVRDAWGAIAESFSAPKVRLGQGAQFRPDADERDVDRSGPGRRRLVPAPRLPGQRADGVVQPDPAAVSRRVAMKAERGRDPPGCPRGSSLDGRRPTRRRLSCDC